MNGGPRDPHYPDRIQEIYGAPIPEPTLSDYWRILMKRKWAILACALVTVTLAGLISLRITPVYEAMARVSIAGQTPYFLNFPDKSQAPESGNDQFSIDTQVKILESNTLALLVIRNLGLDKRPEFAGPTATPDKPGVISKLTPQDMSRDEHLMQTFHDNLRVQQVPDTSIIEIKYSSPDASLAADVANATAQTFIEQNIKARYDSTMQAADWLSKQLADLQIKVEASQAKLVEYQKEHGIIGADDKQNLTVEKLEGLGKELTQAQGERIQKQSLYETAKSGNGETVSAVLQDPVLSSLRQQETELEAEDAQLSIQFGSSYPKVQEVRGRLKLIKQAYNKALQNGIQRVQNDYEADLKREQMLQRALDDQTALADQLNVSAIEYKLLKQEADSNRQMYDGLLEKLKEASLAAGLNSSNIRIVDNARVPLAPARPNIPRNLEYALMLGLVGGIAMAFALESIDKTVRRPEQVESISGLPMLAMIPWKGDLQPHGPRKATALLKPSQPERPASLISYFQPQSEIAEAYRALRTSILLSSAGGPPRTMVITSPIPQDGKTMVSINTAIVLAQQGRKVLLVDADLRRPSLHLAFGLRPQVGLSNILSGGVDTGAATFSTRQRNLFVLAAGTRPPQPSELLSSALMQQLLSQWREEYDHVIIDSPPVLSVTDAVLLSVLTDAVLLVVRSAQTTTGAMRRARDLLLHLKCNLLGVVFNAADVSSLSDYYSGSRYDAYYTDGKRKRRRAPEEQDSEDESNSVSSSGD
ncbi:MAG: polysaccharide biosynthesis tyrosine autokinase [Acidobacteriaceae bacterium]|nr:polysaccharide biosynthesis tyrosine autokinase [Acidobacteriaceae bacterium]